MEPVEIGMFKCSQPECSIETTGKCVNGLPISECPNKLSIVKDEPVTEATSTPVPLIKGLKIPWGESFKEEDLEQITYKYPCKLILVIGEPSCGKTTLYAALMDSFHKGSCGNFIFSSTRTPIGFERICHLAREKSNGRTPKAERTKTYEFTYMHLSVKDKELKDNSKHILFADVNGERYQAARDNEEEIKKLTIITRADHIFFVADGDLLKNDADKHAVRNNMWKMIERCTENKMFSKKQKVHLIVTKWDEITSDGRTNDVTDYFINPTISRYPLIFNQVIKIASRSMNDEVPPRSGIADFLETCLSENNNQVIQITQPEAIREFQKFKYQITNE